MLKKVVYGRSSNTWINFILAKKISAILVHRSTRLCKMCVLSEIVFIFAVSCVCVYGLKLCVYFYCGKKLQILERQELSCESFLKQKKKGSANVCKGIQICPSLVICKMFSCLRT